MMGERLHTVFVPPFLTKPSNTYLVEEVTMLKNKAMGGIAS